jgi:hypothetical protein
MRHADRMHVTLLCAMVATAGMVAGCGGDGAAPAPAPPPVAGTPPPPAASPPSAPPPAAFRNDKLCGTVLDGPNTGQESCAANGSLRFNSAATRPICLGGACADPFTYTVRIDTRPQYLAPLTLRVVHCPSPATGANRSPAACRDPLRNTPDNFGMLGASFDLPNGAAGPATSITIRLLSSTWMTDAQCTPAGQTPPISDANAVEVSDEAGNKLYLDVQVGGRYCGA